MKKILGMIMFVPVFLLGAMALFRSCDSDPNSALPSAGCPADSTATEAVCPGDTTTTATPSEAVVTSTTGTAEAASPVADPAANGGDTYLALRSYYDTSLHEIEPDLGTSDIRTYCSEAASIDAQFATDVGSATWPSAAQATIDALLAAITLKQQVEQSCTSSPNAASATTLWNEQTTINAHQAAAAADVAVRSVLGLPAPTG